MLFLAVAFLAVGVWVLATPFTPVQAVATGKHRFRSNANQDRGRYTNEVVFLLRGKEYRTYQYHGNKILEKGEKTTLYVDQTKPTRVQTTKPQTLSIAFLSVSALLFLIALFVDMKMVPCP
jgi:hypothetical protein